MDTGALFSCKHCSKKFKSKGGFNNHEKKCKADEVLENTMIENQEPVQQDNSDPKNYSENELIILKASDFDRMITEYLKIFIEHYNSQMSKLIDENKELVTYSNTLAEILKSIVCSKKTTNT
jgi:hypothetical protein